MNTNVHPLLPTDDQLHEQLQSFFKHRGIDEYMVVVSRGKTMAFFNHVDPHDALSFVGALELSKTNLVATLLEDADGGE